MNVLVAVGDRRLAELLGVALTQHGMTSDVVSDGITALEQVTAQEYRVVVLDRDLPAVGGDVVCTHLTAAHRETRILLLISDIRQHREWWLGADECVTAPFSAAVITARVLALGAAEPDVGYRQAL